MASLLQSHESMENQKQEQESKKLQESLRKIQEQLNLALQNKQYWGLDQKLQSLQRSFHVQGRV